VDAPSVDHGSTRPRHVPGVVERYGSAPRTLFAENAPA
jgi:hypothetical protein